MIPIDAMMGRNQRIAIRRCQGGQDNQDALAAIAEGDQEVIAEWSQPLTKEEKADRKALNYDLWLAGGTTREIAGQLGIHRNAAFERIRSAQEISLKQLGSDDPPVYNVWNFAQCDPRFGQKHPGQIPGQAVVNLLLRLTESFDLVVDPMGGGGTVIDVCKYLSRRYQVFDKKSPSTCPHK